ncbi:hypothetical protein FA95DRAFT_1612202 [Auriscalpium vulgare]|uniref:Uncharacterized protein n=1 Tax=Auriscalpium vulgare TaxID=40419 RepID=A0ACB8R7I9_9AGAM|nr:hypothetical protein FA95DRAFT_1612202 [Auriscalpium vulgare]
MDRKFQCRGCLHQFSFSGLSRHLLLTSQPRCVAFRDAQRAYRTARRPTSRSPSPVAGPSTHPVHHTPEPSLSHPDDSDHELPDDASFPGDFYGTDYQDDDFTWAHAGEEDEEQAEDHLHDPAGPLDDEPGDDDLPIDDVDRFEAVEVHREREASPRPETLDEDEELGENLSAVHPGQPAWDETVVVPFPGAAGAVVANAEPGGYNKYGESVMGDPTNEYHPFPSKLAWEVAKWAKLRGPTSTALTDLLSIDEVYERLNLPFKNAKELNAIIDHQLPRRPRFKQDRVSVGGQSFDVYYRDALECIKALYSDPEFAPHMAFAPERHYADEDQTNRVYNEMKTGKWWWRVQQALEQRKAGATVVPLLISTDGTQLTLFRNKSAYPIYLTIGNIPKDIRRKPSRRAQILLGYLPTSRLTHIKDKETRRRALANVFHACMRKILRALRAAGLDGVNMASGDGVVRRCHPILAAYIGDYPEQCRVVGCKNRECPKGCVMEPGQLGDLADFERRDMEDVLDALATAADGPEAYLQACSAIGIKPLHHPFWEDLPLTNIYESITPDILHQLYQGLVKRVIGWLKKIVGEDEIDARFHLEGVRLTPSPSRESPAGS